MATYDLKYPGAAIDAILDTAYDLQNAGYIFRGLASEYSNTPTERSWLLAGEGETGHGFTSPIPKGYIGVCVFNGTSWTGKLLKCVSIDSTPTNGSTNALSSGGAYASISQLADTVNEALDNLTFTDTTPSAFLGEYITEKVSTTDGGLERILTYFTILAATTSKAGLLSAADKAKLDALWSSGYQFVGIATPSTTPISTTSKIFYIATEAGTYFNAVTVTQGINILSWNGSAWSVVQVVGIDDEPTVGSSNLVESGGVSAGLNDIHKTLGDYHLSDSFTGPTFHEYDYTFQAGVIYRINSEAGSPIFNLYNGETLIHQFDGNESFSYKAASTGTMKIYSQIGDVGLSIVSSDSIIYTTESIASDVDKLTSHTALVKWAGEGYGINVSDGSDMFAENRNRTDFLLTDQLEEIIVDGVAKFYVVYYDSSKDFISSDGWIFENTYDFSEKPSGAMYCKILIDTSVCSTTDIIAGYLHTSIYNIEGSIKEICDTVYGYTSETSWSDVGINVNTGATMAAENRESSGHVDVETVDVVAINATSPSYYIIWYDSSKNFLSSVGWNTTKSFYTSSKPLSAKYFRIMLNTTTVTSSNVTLVKEGIDAGNIKKDMRSVLVVDANGNGDYTTIEGALAAANDTATSPVTIIVKPGEYTPAPAFPGEIPYNESHRNITLIGVNRDTCILKGNVGYYYYQEGVDYSLLRLNGNVLIKNFTMISTCENYEAVATEEGWDLTSPHARAYCVHVDGGRGANTTVRIENCKMYNDHFTCVGYGLRSNAPLIIKDCECISEVSDATEQKSGFSQYGTIYGHLAAGQSNAPNQRIEIIECLIKNVNHSCGVMQMDASGASDYSNISAQLLYVRNTVRTSQQSGAFVNRIPQGVYTIDNWSFGNNVETMNYT